MSNKSNLSGLCRFLPQEFLDPKTSNLPEAKKRQTDALSPIRTRYDASALVPHHRTVDEVPENVQKYFLERESLFSLYDQGCLLDEEGWYSVTPESIAVQIANRCQCDTILDPFCGVGGNAIAFAKTCKRVIALDVSPVRLALARHNAAIYGVADRIEFILADYISFANMYLLQSHPTRRIDVVFLSPPWGGPGYLSPSKPPPVSEVEHPDKQEVYPEYSLSRIKPIHGADLFHLTKRISNNIAYFLPKTTSLHEISALLDNDKDESAVTGDEPQVIDVEEEWMGSKLTALTCYFGGLVAGKEHMM